MAPRAPRTVEADLPESDRAGDMPHPRLQERLFGHEAAMGQMVKAARAGTLHHAWLICGPKGVGKATLAWRFARALLAHGAASLPEDLDLPPAHPAFRLVAAASHPDLALLRRPWDSEKKRFKSELPVDEVRKLKAFFSRHPSLGEARVALIDCMDDMNIQAQNALLKILEEPPKAAVMLLIAHAPGQLLPTIRSRCRVLQLRPLSPPDMQQALQHLAPEASAEHLAIAATLCEGAPGNAAAMATSGIISAYQQILGLLGTLPQVNQANLHGLAEQFMKQFPDQGIEGFSNLLSLAMQRHLRCAMGTTAALAAEQKVFARMGQAIAPARWGELWADLQVTGQRATALNLDKKQFVLNAFNSIESAARA
jgi:DNA polymerase-3 subunit delta'